MEETDTATIRTALLLENGRTAGCAEGMSELLFLPKGPLNPLMNAKTRIT